MRGRDVFLNSLRLHGATKIFGNPGTTESPLLDNLVDHPDIEYIMHLHEGVAVGAANIYAQASGHTAVANMHVAPGLGNAIGMIYGALKNNSPMVVTAGAQDTRIRLRDPVLGHDLVSLAAPVTKWSVQVEHADEMATVMQRAFKVANQHPAGPVFVALPINVMEQETTVDATTPGELVTQSIAGDPAIADLAAILDKAAKPVIVAGDDVTRAGATAELVSLSEAIGAPVFVEILTGTMPFPSGHDHFRGRLGPDARAIHGALDDFDLVIMVGGPFFEEIWYSDASPFGDNADIVHLENTPERLGRTHSVTLGVSGELKDMLGRLATKVTDAGDKRRDNLREQKYAMEADAEARFDALKERSPMTPARALFEVARHIAEDAIIVDETITASFDVVRHFDLGGKQTYLGGRGGGIGQGVAGAIGAAVAKPDQQIIAVSGDGSAMYSIQALWTAAHHDLNILFIILSNREYRVLKHNIDQYRRRFDAPSNKAYPHMDLSRPIIGFESLAAGMGVRSAQVADADQIGSAIKALQQESGPALLDLIVEGMETR